MSTKHVKGESRREIDRKAWVDAPVFDSPWLRLQVLSPAQLHLSWKKWPLCANPQRWKGRCTEWELYAWFAHIKSQRDCIGAHPAINWVSASASIPGMRHTDCQTTSVVRNLEAHQPCWYIQMTNNQMHSPLWSQYQCWTAIALFFNHMGICDEDLQLCDIIWSRLPSQNLNTLVKYP